MQRGEVWWARLPPPVGRRPVLLLSRDRAYQIRKSITVAPISRTIRNIPVEVPVDESDGMPTRSAVNLDDIITIPIAVLEDRITALSSSKMIQIKEAVVFALDLA